MKLTLYFLAPYPDALSLFMGCLSAGRVNRQRRLKVGEGKEEDSEDR
jgi:hypothetical protein